VGPILVNTIPETLLPPPAPYVPTADDRPPVDSSRRERRAVTLARRRRVRRRIRRAFLAVLLVFTVVAAWSLGHALLAPGNDPAGVKFVEWVRDHGGGSAVDRIEAWWYTNHEPRRGGTPQGGIPKAKPPVRAGRVAAPATPAREPVPTNLSPIATTPLPNEGVWQPTGKLVDGQPVIYQTFLRPDTVHTSLVTGAVWMNAHRLRAVLHNGLQLPGGGPWSSGPKIEPSDYPVLAAAFNGGFRLNASRGGYYTETKEVKPLVDGRASLVIKNDGTISVGQWGRDFHMAADIASVRQNLDLVVDGGHPVPGLLANDHSRWGATLGGKVYVWRSGLGVDKDGNLIYVGGEGLDITTLADVLARAGAVRAMELDINSEWVSFYTYSGTGPTDIRGNKLLGSIQRPADRYLKDGTRDFVALMLR